MAIIFEPRWNKEARQQRDAVRYPELELVKDPAELLRIDAANIRDSQPLSSFGQTHLDTFARLGVDPQERTQIEAETQRDLSFINQPNNYLFSSGFSRGGPSYTPSPVEAQQFQLERQRLTEVPQSQGGTQPTPFELADRNNSREAALLRDLELTPPTQTNRNDPRYVEDPRITELRALGPGTPDLIEGLKGLDFGAIGSGIQSARGRAAESVRSGVSDVKSALTGFSQPAGALLQNPMDLQAGQETAQRIETATSGGLEATRGATFLASGVDVPTIAQHPFAFVSGRQAVDAVLKNWTYGEAGLNELGLSEETTPRLVNELIEALAPINFVAAFGGGTISTSLRAAASGRSKPVSAAINALAGIVEPFAGKGVPALGREVAADVAAQEAFALTEGAPGPVRLGAAIVAGGVAGMGPEVSAALARGAIRSPDAITATARTINRFDAEAAIRSADPTALSRAAGELPPGSVLGVADPGDGGIRGIRAIAGASGDAADDVVEPSLVSARASLLDAYTRENTINRIGIAQRETRVGRSAQAGGIKRSLEEGIAAGLEGEDLAIYARQGAAVGTLRQTFAQPVELTLTERAAVFGELTRKLADGEIDQFQFLQTTEALSRMINGEGLRPFELRSVPLNDILGRELVEQGAQQGPRTTREAWDLKIRNETDRFNATAQRVEQRAIAAQEKANLAALDARIKSLEQPIDLSTPIGVRASFIDELDSAKLAAIKAANEHDATIIRQTERWNEGRRIAQDNAATRETARLEKRGQQTKELAENLSPNVATLKQRALAVLDRVHPDTDVPKVDPALREEVAETIEKWLKNEQAIMRSMGEETESTISAVAAYIRGDLADPYMTELVHARNNLRGVLRNAGVDDQSAKQISDIMFERQLVNKFGTGIGEIRAVRNRDAARNIRQRYRSTGLDLPKPDSDEWFKLVDDEIAALSTERWGKQLVAQEQRIEKQLRQTRRPIGVDGMRSIVQETKNFVFGMWDIGVFGVNLLASGPRGAVVFIAKWANDLLALAHMPHVRGLYADSNLSRMTMNALDGLDQSSLASSFDPSERSILGRLFPPSRIDIPGVSKIPGIGLEGVKGANSAEGLMLRAANRLSDFQYGTVMTWVRNQAFEGELVMLHRLGEDIADPLVRAKAASAANNIGSSARPALRGGRRAAEEISLTSSRMARARVETVTRMARLITPNTPMVERKIAAMMIASQVSFTLAAGFALNAAIGTDKFEFDPSKPGFGTITLPNGRVVDVISQDTIVRAFATSLRELADGNLSGVGEQWVKGYLGSASVLGRVPPALLGYGYEPGKGYALGDLTQEGTILNLAPLPPFMSDIITEGWDTTEQAFNLGGFNTYDESPYREGSRIINDNLGDFDWSPDLQESLEATAKRLGKAVSDLEASDLDGVQRRDALAEVGLLDRLEQQSVEQLEARAGREDREAQALLLGDEKRQELNRIYEDAESKEDYRDRRSDVVKRFLGKAEPYQDIFDGFSESDNEIVRLAGERWDLIDLVTTGSELDFDLLEELQLQFDAGLDPSLREAVLSYINAIDPRDNPYEQELDRVGIAAADAGWWDLGDEAWAGTGFQDATGFATYGDWRADMTSRLKTTLIEGGIPPGVAVDEAEDEFNKLSLKQDFDEVLRTMRLQWLVEDPKHIELADQLLEWGLWSSAPKDAEDIIAVTLYGKN